jgi:signal transduction histidine kinase
MDGILLGTSQGIFEFKDIEENFVPLSILNAYPQSDASYSVMSGDSVGNIFFNSALQLIMLHKEADNKFKARFRPFLRLPDFKIYKIYPEANGVLWLGGPEGIYRYDPSDEDNFEQELACYLRRVISFGDSVIFDGANQANQTMPVLPFSSKAMRLEFAAPYFIQEDQTQYRFYLKGFDSEWSKWTFETKKDYTNIPEGIYTFVMEAKNIYGQVSSPATFSFQIQAPVYRRWWAYLIYIILSILLVSFTLRRLLHYTRTKAILEQQKIEDTKRKIEEELRSQVAADFHDELGTQITRISLFSEILNNELVNISDQAKTYLQKIRKNADDLYGETRDFIWQLDPKLDTLMDFISRIKSFANDLLDGTDINFILENEITDSENIKLPMDLRRNLVRIFKEALHNAFKYANCENLTFKLTENKDGFEFLIRDDGIGFDTSKASDGNGLLNMKNRAKKVNGILQINSNPQTGTEIKLMVKI